MTYSASITLNGQTYNYPGGPTLPGFYVFIRPDEIIFHWGNSKDRSVPAAALPAYTAQVFQDGNPVKTYNVPKGHAWYGRWLHKITPDKIIRTPADIIAQRLMLPYGVIGGRIPLVASRSYANPLDTASIATYMGATGEREDIGLIGEWSAHFMLTGDPGPMLAVADAAFSVDMHVMNEATGAPWDKIAHPLTNTYYRQEGPEPLIQDPGDDVWSWDDSHHPEMSGMAYFATGLLRHLENLQYQANMNFMGSIFYDHIVNDKYSVFNLGQTRGAAWDIRSLLLAWKATTLAEADGPLPSYLLPSSVFKAMLDNARAFITKYFVNDPAIQTFRFYPSEAGPDAGYQDYFNQVLNLAALYLPDEWGPILIWSLGNVIPRCNGKSGWPPANPTGYRIRLGPNLVYDQSTVPPNPLKASDFFPDWATCWQANANDAITTGNAANLTAAQAKALLADPYNGMQFNAWIDYAAQEVDAVLAGAVYLDRNGIVPISATWPDLENCFATIRQMNLNWMKKSPNNAVAARISIDPGVVAPPVIVSPPPVTQPPLETPPMPDPVPTTDPLAALKKDVEALVNIVPKVQAGIDALQAQRDALKATAASGGTLNTADVAALVSKLDGAIASLTSAVTDAGS